MTIDEVFSCSRDGECQGLKVHDVRLKRDLENKILNKRVQFDEVPGLGSGSVAWLGGVGRVLEGGQGHHTLQKGANISVHLQMLGYVNC